MSTVKKQRRNLRKRRVNDDESEDETVVSQKKAKQITSDKTVASTEEKRPTDSVFAVEGDRTVQFESDQGATRQLETETEFDRDARSRREKQLRADTDATTTADNRKYKGLSGYVDYTKGFKKESSIAQEKATGAHGPLRGSTYIRMSARFDYQPDICKDYKETGFCSFGDSCKFLHDRGDYKSGWELEQEWEAERQREKEALQKLADGVASSEEEQSDQDDDHLPFACFICRKRWEETKQTPVVTQCKHYFCQQCALQHNSKSPKCFVCETATRGIFNVARDIVKRLKKQKEKGNVSKG